MDQLFGGIPNLGWVALKALLLYTTAIIGFRLGERRTLAEMSAFDFVAAVAVGAIIGRVPNSSSTSYLAGAVTLVTLLVAHAVVTRLRQFPPVVHLVDHPPRVLVQDGHVLHKQLRGAGLTQDDLFGLLRERGILDLSQVRFVIFERRGKISVVSRANAAAPESPILRDVVEKMLSS